MPTRALLTLYAVLIVLFALILFLVVLALIVFRDSIESCCCRRGQPLIPRRMSFGGELNPTFVEQSRPRRLPEQRPFDPMEAVETPPSYEEAVKQELFRFRPLSTPQAGGSDQDLTTSTEVNNSSHEFSPSVDPSGAFASDSHSQPIQDQNMPSTSAIPAPRRRTPTISAVTSQLSTISEEDSEDWPVTVIIDRIGVQAARLLEHCDTTISLESGSELGTHSKC